MTKKIDLSIIIPCYNEGENIPIVLEEFKKVNDDFKGKMELILVNNNSSDDSKDILKKELTKKKFSFARTVFQSIPGYGAALGKGLEKAKGEFLCWTHADLQTPPKDTIKAYNLIIRQKNYKKIYVKGERKRRPLFDQFFTSGMSLFESLILKTIMYDINAQPNIFHRSFMDRVKSPPEDFSFDLYFYYIAKKRGYRIMRFPVIFGNRIHGESSWNNSFSDKLKFIKRTIDFTFKMKKNLKKLKK